MITEYIKTKPMEKTIRDLAEMLSTTNRRCDINIGGIIEGKKYLLRRIPYNSSLVCWMILDGFSGYFSTSSLIKKEINDCQEYLELADKVFVLESTEDLKTFLDMDV